VSKRTEVVCFLTITVNNDFIQVYFRNCSSPHSIPFPRQKKFSAFYVARNGRNSVQNCPPPKSILQQIRPIHSFTKINQSPATHNFQSGLLPSELSSHIFFTYLSPHSIKPHVPSQNSFLHFITLITLVKNARYKGLYYIILSTLLLLRPSSSSVICQTTGPQPLPKRFLHLMRSRASSFK
jgi:hypothetical protein